VLKREIPLEYQAHLDKKKPPSGGRGITFRAVLVGGLISLFIGVSLPYTNMIIKGSLLAHNFNTPAALFTFFIFVAFINVGLGFIKKSFGLAPAELVTIYIMALLATSIPTIGFSEYLLPIIAGLYYFATPENKWAEIIHPHIPKWMVPQDQDALLYFFEGLPEGMPVPWDAWIGPLFYWCFFILAVFWVSMCTMVIFRKQWVHHEKLLYPLVQLPLEMVQDDKRRSLIKPFFKNPFVWIGFAIPMLLGTFAALHSYYPAMPSGAFGNQGIFTTQFSLFGGATVLIVMLNLGLVGFAYLLSNDVAVGLWFFFLLSTIERGLFNMVGIQSSETLSRFANASGPYLAHQAMGAMIVSALAGIWVARVHIGQVLLKAFKNDAEVDDSEEILSYKATIWGLLIGLVVITVWLWKTGIPLWIVPIFLFSVLVVFMTLTRAVVEGGIAVLRTPLTPADFVISGLGTSVLGAAGIVGLGFTYIWAANIRIFFMPCFANALKLAEEIQENKRPLLWVIFLAIVLALGSSIWSIMVLAYKYGGINLHEFWFIGVPRNAANYMAQFLKAPSPVSTSGWLFTGVGAGLMGALTYVRMRFVWWPLHPLGFAVSTFSIMNYVWFSIFTAWSLKSLVLKYGGPGLYNRTKPFFLGLILGQIFVSGMWLIIDYITGMIGNQPIGGSFV
jgi:hypothetical protein